MTVQDLNERSRKIARKLATARAGDLLFFSGRSSFPSRLIAFGTSSPWQLLRGQWISHVGILFEHQGGFGRLLLGESTTLNTEPCEITGKRIEGVQAHMPVNRIASYQGKVWIARLEPDYALDLAENEKLTKLAIATMGQPYDSEGAGIAGGCILRSVLPENTGKVFCSKWASWLLKHVHRWPIEAPANSETPAGMARKVVRMGTHRKLERVK